MLMITNVRLLDPATGRDEKADIYVENDRVSKIVGLKGNASHNDPCKSDDLTSSGVSGENCKDANDRSGFAKGDSETCEVIDGTGLCAAPGFVDVHVHFRDPGFTYKEDVGSGATAAAFGGFTSVVCMANTSPVADSAEVIDDVIKRGAATGIHVYQAGSVTKGLKGKELTDFETLMAHGAPGFTDDGIPILDENILRQAMEKSAALNVPLSFHEENPQYIENNGINSDYAKRELGIGGSDRQAEISMIERDVALAKETKAIVNVQHISTAEGVDIIRKAVQDEAQGAFRNDSQSELQDGNMGTSWKEACDGSQGTSVSRRRIHAEACPHHFTLTQEALSEHGTLAKMNPPLRLESDRQAIIAGLKDGTIDIIATDHAPHAPEEKARELTKAPSGILGLQTAFALGITQLVKPGHLTLMQLMEKMSLNPAGLYGFDAGRIYEGGPADITIFDPDEEWTFTEDMIRSKSVNSPFIGWKLTGRVKYTISAGKIVFS